MTSRALLSSGLPPRLVERVTKAFHLLDCTEPAMQALIDTLGAWATAHNISDPSAIQRIFALLVAANHSATRLSGPHAPLPTPAPDVIPSPSEWLLLAARERALATLPQALGDAFDQLVVDLDAAFTTNCRSTSSNSPVVDYGCGSLLAAIASPTNAHASFATGQTLGKLTRLALEVLLCTRTSSPFLSPVLLHSIFAQDHESAARLRLATALACKPVPDKLPLLSFHGHPNIRAAIVTNCTTWSDAAMAACEQAHVVSEIVEVTSHAIAQKLNSLRLFGLAKPTSLVPELDRTIALAVEGLLADPELREAWEVQRWGGPFPSTCVGKFFPVGLCTLALAEASVDPAERVANLMSLGCADGFRYFEGFAGIAPDADDFGLALQLVARTSQRDAYIDALAWPIEVVVRNTSEQGEIPVWLEHHLREPRMQDAPQWRGSRCLAVAANAVIGLLEARVPLPAKYIDRAIAWITRTWREIGMGAVFFYGLSYTRFVLVRLADVAEGRVENPAVGEELQVVARTIEDAIITSVRDDGGFGGIIDTACHLAALSCGRRSPFDPWPIIAFLASRQEHDGFWPAEPLYPTPGKDYAPGAHGSRAMTTALCLFALARARSRLSS